MPVESGVAISPVYFFRMWGNQSFRFIIRAKPVQVCKARSIPDILKSDSTLGQVMEKDVILEIAFGAPAVFHAVLPRLQFHN